MHGTMNLKFILHALKEERNILHTMEGMLNYTSHIAYGLHPKIHY
jgi:hypothetical protein